MANFGPFPNEFPFEVILMIISCCQSDSESLHTFRLVNKVCKREADKWLWDAISVTGSDPPSFMKNAIHRVLQKLDFGGFYISQYTRSLSITLPQRIPGDIFTVRVQASIWGANDIKKMCDLVVHMVSRAQKVRTFQICGGQYAHEVAEALSTWAWRGDLPRWDFMTNNGLDHAISGPLSQSPARFPNLLALSTDMYVADGIGDFLAAHDTITFAKFIPRSTRYFHERGTFSTSRPPTVPRSPGEEARLTLPAGAIRPLLPRLRRISAFSHNLEELTIGRSIELIETHITNIRGVRSVVDAIIASETSMEQLNAVVESENLLLELIKALSGMGNERLAPPTNSPPSEAFIVETIQSQESYQQGLDSEHEPQNTTYCPLTHLGITVHAPPKPSLGAVSTLTVVEGLKLFQGQSFAALRTIHWAGAVPAVMEDVGEYLPCWVDTVKFNIQRKVPYAIMRDQGFSDG